MQCQVADLLREAVCRNFGYRCHSATMHSLHVYYPVPCTYYIPCTQFSLVDISSIRQMQYTGYVSVDTSKRGARRYFFIAIAWFWMQENKCCLIWGVIGCIGIVQVSGQKQELLHELYILNKPQSQPPAWMCTFMKSSDFFKLLWPLFWWPSFFPLCNQGRSTSPWWWYTGSLGRPRLSAGPRAPKMVRMVSRMVS